MSLVQQRLQAAPHSHNYVPFLATRAATTVAHCQGPAPKHPTHELVDRRSLLVLTSSLVTAVFAVSPSSSVAAAEAIPGGRGLSRYIKKKQLDPLDTYVPLVLEARQQLSEASEIMREDQGAARDLLRTGAFNGLRDNIRALGEYAVTNGKQKEAATLVNAFFNSLGDYDRVLFLAIKGQEEFDLAATTEKAQSTIKALDALLATVPADIMDKSQSILQRILATAPADEAAQPSEDDKLLRSLLN